MYCSLFSSWLWWLLQSKYCSFHTHCISSLKVKYYCFNSHFMVAIFFDMIMILYHKDFFLFFMNTWLSFSTLFHYCYFNMLHPCFALTIQDYDDVPQIVLCTFYWLFQWMAFNGSWLFSDPKNKTTPLCKRALDFYNINTIKYTATNLFLPLTECFLVSVNERNLLILNAISPLHN